MKQKRVHSARSKPVKRRAGQPKATAHRAVSRRSVLRQQIRARRPFHKRLVLHPISVMAILMLGVLFVGWTFRAAADTSYTVTAKVPAAPLLQGATITDPTDGDIVTTSPITVSGSCPDNSYITLTRNGVFSGVAVCATDHTYSIDTSLSAGSNSLLIQDFNSTDDPGPATSIITITYNPPVTPTPPSGSGTTSSQPTSSSRSTSGSPQPLLLTSDFRFQTFTTGSTFNWNIAIQGGIAPYVSNVDWGDKHKSSASYPRAETINISHTYTTAGYFPVQVELTDETGATTMLQLVALIKAPGTAGALFQTPQSSSTGSGTGNGLLDTFTGSSKWLLLAWPTYGITALMAVSFWLGEHQELRRLLSAANNVRNLSKSRHAHT